ncbi:MAG: hypothetical protein ACRENN_03080, partial [Candidatus Eiseniibacteriota bacterium]
THLRLDIVPGTINPGTAQTVQLTFSGLAWAAHGVSGVTGATISGGQTTLTNVVTDELIGSTSLITINGTLVNPINPGP